jgi:hypothetical protein
LTALLFKYGRVRRPRCGLLPKTGPSQQKDNPSRSEAIRRLIEIAPAAKTKRQSAPGEK